MIYLDNAGSSIPLDAAIDEATRIMRAIYANASAPHELGRQARLIVDGARGAVMKALGATAGGLIFTSGGTEANNTALCSIRRGRIAISAVEHASVLTTAHTLSQRGISVDILPVTSDGAIDTAALPEQLSADTALVSIMQVNNETGAVNDVATIARIVKRVAQGALLHVDASQGFGKLPPPIADWVTLSAHKFHGVKGCGALYYKSKKPGILLSGGGQEGGLRSGTENVPAIAAMGVAATYMDTVRDKQYARIAALRQHLCDSASALGYGVVSARDASPYIVSLYTTARPAAVTVRMLESRGIYVSTGAACSSHGNKRSHVLDAMGLPPEISGGAFRVSMGIHTTQQDIDTLLGALKEMAHE